MLHDGIRSVVGSERLAARDKDKMEAHPCLYPEGRSKPGTVLAFTMRMRPLFFHLVTEPFLKGEQVCNCVALIIQDNQV